MFFFIENFEALILHSIKEMSKKLNRRNKKKLVIIVHCNHKAQQFGSIEMFFASMFVAWHLLSLDSNFMITNAQSKFLCLSILGKIFNLIKARIPSSLFCTYHCPSHMNLDSQNLFKNIELAFSCKPCLKN
jgi:hypothetical protein